MTNAIAAFVQALDIGQLVPERYAAYRSLVAEALAFFLDRLPASRRTALLADQLSLATFATLAERVVAVMRQCPTLHKLGQLIARDRRLAPDFRAQLQTLESLPSTIPAQEILETIQREVGRSDITVIPRTIAEASVAVVVPFAWRERPGAPRQDGVFKVLKPGVEGRLTEELQIWAAVAEFLAERTRKYGLPVLECQEMLDQVRDLLASEIHLDREQAHLAEAARLYAGNRAVLIPRLFPFSTSRLTAMERVDGRKVTDVTGSEARRRLGNLIVQALVATPFWSEAGTSMFHADPHAGNLLLTGDDRLAILDWSLVGHLNKAAREHLMQVLLGALTLDPARICEAARRLSARPSGPAASQAVVAAALAELRRGAFPGFEWLVGLLDRLAVAGAAGFPADLLFFRKALLSVSGVVADVDSATALDENLLQAGLAQFFREFFSRAGASPDFRGFGTHVSNADLLGLWASWPLTALRLWLGLWQDSLEGSRTHEMVPNPAAA